MAILSKPAGIAMAAVVGIAVGTALGQSTPVLTGAASYGDWRSDAPGVRRRITPGDMPPAYATPSANRHPTIVARPDGAWPKAPPSFAVELFASGLDNPRLLRVAPGGDIFVAESRPGRIRVLRATNDAGTPEIHTFADGLDRPFGIAFWPPGGNPRYVYVADTDAVVRFPYRPGDLQPAGPPRRSSPDCRGAAIGPATSSSPKMVPGCSSRWVRAATMPSIQSPRCGARRRSAPTCSSSLPRARTNGSLRPVCAIASGWRCSPEPASCGARPTSATASATTSRLIM